MDTFFTKKFCDRCGESFAGKSRIMSMFNTDCICMNCKEKEKHLPNYKTAREAEINEIKSGNFNFAGIGL